MKSVLIFQVTYPTSYYSSRYGPLGMVSEAMLYIEEHEDAVKKLSDKDFLNFSKENERFLIEFYVKSCSPYWIEESDYVHEHFFVSAIPFIGYDGREYCAVRITFKDISSINVGLVSFTESDIWPKLHYRKVTTHTLESNTVNERFIMPITSKQETIMEPTNDSECKTEAPIKIQCKDCGYEFATCQSKMVYVDGGVYLEVYKALWYSDFEVECPECGSRIRIPVQGGPHLHRVTPSVQQ